MQSKRVTAIILGAVLVLAARGQAQFSDPGATLLSAMTVPQAQQMLPGELAGALKADVAERPMVLQVGSRVMFAQAHIPGSVFAGPGSQAAGLHLLEKAVASTPKGKLIVIYCGCCPWNHCPNIGPAFKRLHDLGFTNVKALYIAKNFGDDWVAKGYATDKGE